MGQKDRSSGSGPISLSGVTISGSSVAVGRGARSGAVSPGQPPDWESALLELCRLVEELRESGDISVEVADRSLERADVLRAELGKEEPGRAAIGALLTSLVGSVEGVARLGEAAVHLGSVVRSAFLG
jgi:hypothetical protein